MSSADVVIPKARLTGHFLPLFPLFFSCKAPRFPIPTPHSSPSQVSKMILEADWPGFGPAEVLLAAEAFGVFAFRREAVSIDVLQEEGGEEGGNGKEKKREG